MLRNCTNQMERSIEILRILRSGLESMIRDAENASVRYTRIFNFNDRRVALRMEVSEHGGDYVPMGRIDVLEIPTNNGRITCSCTLTELQTGSSQRIVLRLKNKQEREKECEKVFGFFRNVLSLKEKSEPANVETHPKEHADDEGFPMSTRGAHQQAPKD